jgi:hypothetical protein
MKKTSEEIEAMKQKYPALPEYALPITRKKRTPANELAYQIINHVQSLSGQCYRINSQGQYDVKLKMWRKSGSTNGLADLQAIILGRYVAIEIKIGRDTQSEVQKKRDSEIKASGGYYLIAKDIEQFKSDLNQIINNIKG